MKKFQSLFNKSSIIAPKRDNRPFINEGDSTCPFCLVNESSLERIIKENWQDGKLFIRIVPNLYPLTSQANAPGVHDVVIDTEQHTLHPMNFSYLHWEVLMLEIFHRWHTIMLNPKIRIIQVFKNYGSKAGASISHSHWQIVALEDIPYSLSQRYRSYNIDSECYLCSILHNQEGYKIWESISWEIWIPPIPEFPYEVWLVPKIHYQHYGQLRSEEIKELGRLIKNLLQVYHQLNPGYSFNICFMAGDLHEAYSYHFHIKLVMRTGQIAGFELTTGCHIISESPSNYATKFKKLLQELLQ